MNKPVWAVMTGTIRDEIEFRLTLEQLILWRNERKIDGIIFSTWKNEPDKVPGIRTLLTRLHVEVLEIEPVPEKYEKIETNSVNYWRQAMQLQAAIDILPEDVFIFKTRTDRALKGMKELACIFEEGLEKTTDACLRYGMDKFPTVFEYKMAIQKPRTNRILHFVDFTFICWKADLRRIINFDLSELYLHRDLVANTQFFALPFLHEFPIIRDYFRMINFRPLIRDLKQYVELQKENSQFPDFFLHVYATYFLILMTHFRVVSYLKDKTETNELDKVSFHEFFTSSMKGHLQFTDIGVNINSDKIIESMIFGTSERTINSPATAANSETVSVSCATTKFRRAILDVVNTRMGCTTEMYSQLHKFQSVPEFSGEKWLRKYPGAIPRNVVVYHDMVDINQVCYPFSDTEPEQQRNLWTMLQTSDAPAGALFNYWLNLESPSDNLTTELLLMSAKVDRQESILILSRLLRAGRIEAIHVPEVVRIITYFASIRIVRKKVNALTRLYMMNYWLYEKYVNKNDDKKTEKTYFISNIKDYTGKDIADQIAGSDSVESLRYIFDNFRQTCVDREWMLTYRRAVEIFWELTGDSSAASELLDIMKEKNESNNIKMMEYTIRNHLIQYAGGKNGQA